MATREWYGIDAPGVVRTMAAIGVALFGAYWVSDPARWSGVPGLIAGLRPMMLGMAMGIGIGASWMLWSSLWGKKLVLRRLLGARRWRGDERVLDIGCGRGLVAVGVARRLGAGGQVTGIDLWSARDLSENTAAGALANAAVAGVADRVTIDTGDMRALPYPDASFDVVASMTAIHNIEDRAGRDQAVRELWRVLRPGGQALIFDIHHARAYAAQLRAAGAEVRITGPILLWGPMGWRFVATKPG